jgi:hypothetical protein
MSDEPKVETPEGACWPTEPGWYDLIDRNGLMCPFRLFENGAWWCVVDDPSYKPSSQQLAKGGWRPANPGVGPRVEPWP